MLGLCKQVHPIASGRRAIHKVLSRLARNLHKRTCSQIPSHWQAGVSRFVQSLPGAGPYERKPDARSAMQPVLGCIAEPAAAGWKEGERRSLTRFGSERRPAFIHAVRRLPAPRGLRWPQACGTGGPRGRSDYASPHQARRYTVPACSESA